MSDVLALSTQVAPAKTFTVDDDRFHLLGMAHLSKEDEALVTALFAKQLQLTQRLMQTPDENRGVSLAIQLRDTRLRILTKLTDMPREVAEKLPITAQAQLIEFLEDEFGFVGDGQGETALEGASV